MGHWLITYRPVSPSSVVKWSGAWSWPLTPSSPEVKNA